MRYQLTNKSNMNITQRNNTHPIVQVFKNFINKLRQNPEIYPIKYYKKSPRFRRNWKTPLVK
jgi:hypothetical protein